MRILGVYIVFALLLTMSVAVISKGGSTEELIVGKWEEVSWKYEKVEGHSDPYWLTEIDDKQKYEISQGLIIHQAEVWEFDKDRNLKLIGGNQQEEKVNWKVKGRGNVLELQHENLVLEDYQIQEITEDSLVIHFNSDLQVRGIVKMTFRKVEEGKYAQKI